MNLIRNSGFERGDAAFWEMVTGLSLTADNTEQVYGTYAGKLQMAWGAGGRIRTSDYLTVKPNQVVDLSFHHLTDLAGDLYVYVEEYTEEYELIQETGWAIIDLAAAWGRYATQRRLRDEVCFIRLNLMATAPSDPCNLWIDNVVLNIFNADDTPIRTVEACNLTNKTTSDDTSADLKYLYGYRDYYAEIEVTSMTGTAPTCDVTVCELDQYGNERVIGTFTQFNATTDQRVGIASPIGAGMYVKYVMGGTVTDCDFKVSVIGVR